MDRDADAVMHGSSFLQATHCTTYGRQRDARLDSVWTVEELMTKK